MFVGLLEECLSLSLSVFLSLSLSVSLSLSLSLSPSPGHEGSAKPLGLVAPRPMFVGLLEECVSLSISFLSLSLSLSHEGNAKPLGLVAPPDAGVLALFMF